MLAEPALDVLLAAFFAGIVLPLGAEIAGCGIFCRDVRRDFPALFGDKRANLALALHDQADRHGLDSAGRKPFRNLLPEQRAQLVADDAVENAAGLLRVYAVQIY